jgi:NADH:quinone reductase (non-electrogenic)
LPPHRHGPGAPLCDVAAARVAHGEDKIPHVVIIGAGFGGLSAAKALAKAPVRVTVIDRRNHHLFQPLLYQVATAALSPADIATPIRSILAKQKNTAVLLGNVVGVDKAHSEVVLDDGQRILFDHLIIATGARHSYFGHNEWEPFAPGLKSLEDATEIRRRILLAFERAEIECHAEERVKLLTFVIIGGGPTGVELAGAIAEIARNALASDFRNIDPKSSRVILIEAAPRLLLAFPQSLSENARKTLVHLGVDVRLGKAVTAIDADGVTLGDERIEARTILWGAGVQASPAASWLGVEGDRAGRVPVGPDLSVTGMPNVFVIGDTAHAEDAKGKPYPGVAPVAKQQGLYVARLIAAQAQGLTLPRFDYKDFGNLATIGRSSAVVDFGRLHITGFPAWVLWSVAHIYFLIGFRNRFVVALNWLWAYITFERGARLITQGMESAPQSEKAAPVAEAPRLIANS